MEHQSQSLITTLSIDVGFFAVCVASVSLWRWCRRRRPRHTLLSPVSEAGSSLLHGGGQEQEQAPLNVTVKNYLSFLKTGALLFSVLTVFSIPSYLFPLGWASVDIAVTGMGSVDRVVFDNSDECGGGFPVVNGSDVLNCTADKDARWMLHVPSRGDDPRPAAHYRLNTSLAHCRSDAAFCQAPLLAYGPERGECWLFDAPRGPPRNVSFEGFFTCRGRWHVLSGNAQFMLALVNGATTVLLAMRLLRRLSNRKISELSKSTLWLTELPTADREDGEPFELEAGAFKRVGDDLRSAITAEINKRLQAEGITSFVDEKKVIEVYVVHESTAPSHLAGHAFAILSREAYLSAILLRKKPMCGLDCLRWLPSYVHWRSHTLLKFGIPPWSAVTLRCQRAPPPSDIIWANLHVRYAWLCSRILQFLLFAFLLIFVAPVSLASSVYAVVDSLRHSMQGKVLGEIVPADFWNVLEHLVQQLPSYWLLLMDSVLVPYAIEFISSSERPHLNSRAEASQFKMNLHFLLLNALFVPMLGFLTTDQSILDQAVMLSHRMNGGSFKHALRSVAARGLQIPGILILKYLMNAALVSTGTQLIQVRNLLLRCVCMQDEPWYFAWGYWYAWSMSILFIALSMSIQMPAVLPAAALSFMLMYCVHKEHFKRGVFSVPFEMDRHFEVSIACHMVLAAGLLWFLTATFLYARAPDSTEEIVNLWIPHLPHGKEGARVFLIMHLRAFVSGALLLAALAALAAGHWLFSEGGWLERYAWRRLGERKAAFLVSICNVLALLCMAGALLCKPRVQWLHIQVPLREVFACALLAFALLAWLASLAVRMLGRRLFRGTHLHHLSKELLESCEYQDESELVQQLSVKHNRVSTHRVYPRKSFLVRHGEWYQPSRTMSLQT